MAFGKKKRVVRKVRINREGCVFCKTKSTPDYKNYEDMVRFVTDRARIVGRDRSGVCAKHQRAVAQAVKRARHLGLLPFAPQI